MLKWGSYMKLVSIVLPVYNGENYIEASIESIIQQSYSNFELIVVNDCSTDGTETIIMRMQQKDSRIILINNPTNQKLPRSLNIGFAKAHGDYLTWTSHDNIYKTEAIKILVDALETNRHVGLVYSDYSNIDKDGNIISDEQLSDSDVLPFTNCIGACFMYRKDVWRQIGEYDSSLFLAEDYDYWIRIYKRFPIMHICQNLYLYRCHENSLTETRKEQVKIQTWKVLEKNFFFLYTTLGRKKRFLFLNHLLELANNMEKKDLLKKFYKLSLGYRFYYFRLRTIARIKKNFNLGRLDN